MIEVLCTEEYRQMVAIHHISSIGEEEVGKEERP